VPATYIACLIEPASSIFGLFVTLSEALHVHAKALGILVNVSGSMIGQVLTGKGKLLAVDISGNAGKPNVSECQDSAGNIKTAALKAEKDPSAVLMADFAMEAGLLQFTQEVELMDE
jgi:hypothetical protein